MSFILDALKKAESERSRKSGPVLMDVRIAAPRRNLPAWAWVLGSVLLANLVVLAWLLLRAPAPAPAVIAQGPPAAPVPAPQLPAPVVTPPAVPPAEPLTSTILAPPPPAVPLAIPDLVPEPVPAPVNPVPGTDATPDIDNLPTMQDLIATGVTLPEMRLNLHVYDEAAASRYVLLNSRRMREGDSLPDGTRVVRITPRGVVLDARGRLFLLVAGG
jgi:general secretion pathway protein B